MRYRYITIAGVVAIMGLFTWLWRDVFSSTKPVRGSLYDLTINSLDGKPIDLARYRGKNLLIVNTASKCGYTPQYATLEKLHETYGDRVTVLGFPANNFLWQEPGSNEEIASFCEKNYGVRFQMFEKVSVRGGDQHPLYRWLSAKTGKQPGWNFCKYFVNKKGEVTGFYGPKVSPMDTAIIKQITN